VNDGKTIRSKKKERKKDINRNMKSSCYFFCLFIYLMIFFVFVRVIFFHSLNYIYSRYINACEIKLELIQRKRFLLYHTVACIGYSAALIVLSGSWVEFAVPQILLCMGSKGGGSRFPYPGYGACRTLLFFLWRIYTKSWPQRMLRQRHPFCLPRCWG